MSITRSKVSTFIPSANPGLHDKNALIDVLASMLSDCETKIEKKSGITSKKTFLNKLPHLKECACLDSCFDRTKNSRRFDIETSVIQRTKNHFDKPVLNYLSLGAGFLLQDFIICGYLLLNGYSLCVRLIEHACDKEEFSQAYQQFCCLQLYAHSMKLQFKANYFQTVLEYLREYPEEQIDVAQAVDFSAYYFSDDAKMDLQFIRQKLGDKGFLYFALVDTDLIFTSTHYQHIKGIAYAESGEKFFKASKKVINTENEISNAIKNIPPHITKNIVSYIGLFQLKAPAVKFRDSIPFASWVYRKS